MDKCIFCKKQTSNQYSYYKADKINGTREKKTVFACTKCLNKKSVILPAVLTLLFVMSLLGGISEKAQGVKKEVEFESGPIIVCSVLIFVFLLWTICNIYRIITDKPLSETKAAKKLIRKAKKINPAKFYFTPAENELTHSENKMVTTDNNINYSTRENTDVADLSDTNGSTLSEDNKNKGKLICPRCQSENIKLPGDFAYWVVDSPVTKMHLGFLHSFFEDKMLRFKCKNCKHKW